ncbi:MAG TPA: polyribonucleotide nucleotidyltransferase [Deltaproteobacteria bacterium]|nr:MAG: polyribonucleotide nucleotidyltransferase [Deltaproteobacteria bacterium GWA2_55_82]OIJ73268.1 MAG: polyribonucleotide nucleotidyltransferase [Deltaproteobacteria bacterium GWC2_55_46]HBG45468.1 polyribonucleotide nucleotidyltransferase [Deltaproteobacteria bacterium]HCY10299.1 polyribonucleotide nucleotidyltransferase [Deltaproteobacteria bacterium]
MSIYETTYAGRPLIIETGKMARQAHGSCTVRYGDTVVLVTACRNESPAAGVDFLPLTVNYMEMTYAAGKIPGGFFKREGRPSEKEVLGSRLIDRPLRPLFPEGYFNETQIVATVLSVDLENEPEIAAMIGASAALGISDVPFDGPIAGIRVGSINGELIANPSIKQQKEGDIDLMVAGKEGSIIMVEGGAKFATEEFLVKALAFAQSEMQGVLDLQKRIAAEVGKPNMALQPVVADPELEARVKAFAESRLNDALRIPVKQERYLAAGTLKKETIAALAESFPGREKEIDSIYGDLKYRLMREMVVNENRRVDGRGPREIRPITCEVGLLPRTHGSALFTRGETQAMVVTTLGTSEDEQKIDALSGWEYKNFMLHYNFPPFSVGEVKILRGPGRREIGHGALAERAVSKILPQEGFPYTVRVVSDILESNGSSSMATVCGASLSLMDAGVPTKGHVAGIAMGLIKEGDKVVILSDILGDEDHLGDMDFKVAGTADGVTALQMDIKIGGVTAELLKDALYQAKEGRLHILDRMQSGISTPRAELSVYAPRITTIYVRQEKIKDVIGPGGKNIKGIILATGVKIDIDDTGKVNIASTDGAAAERAIEMVRMLTAEAEIGRIYNGKVKKIVDFGAFVEIFPGTEGLVHISQLAAERVKNVRDILKEGDEVLVKVIDIDKDGKIRLSRKEALEENM